MSDPTLPQSPPSAEPVGAAQPQAEFLALWQSSITREELVKLVLARHTGDEPGLQQLAVRQIVLRGEPALSFDYRYATKAITKNLPLSEGLRTVEKLLGTAFRNAHLLTTTQTVEFTSGRNGQGRLRRRPAERDAAPVTEHDRAKRRHVALDRPFLAALGVTDAQGKLIPAMARKYKQIDKFVEVFAHALGSSPLAAAKHIRVLDFGSGKGYLTFAVHDYLYATLGVQANVTGIELRTEMVALCNAAVAKLGITGLSFEPGDVTRHAPQATDVMIALHACDTATDHAIHFGIEGGASIILCAPCCHKEVRPQLLSPHPMRAVLQHGVHLGQEAEMVTDSLRALLLEASGYATQVFEFVSLEHTAKNKMILAVKRANAQGAGERLAQVAEVKRFYGIAEQRLERLLGERLGRPTARGNA